MRTEIFNERITAAQGAKHVTHANSAAKKSLREQLENDIEKFLSQGGSINTLSGIDFKPKQPSKCIERIKPWRTEKTPKYANLSGNTELLEWCYAKVGRITRLARAMNVSVSYIQERVQGKYPIMVNDFREYYRPNMSIVERNEKVMG